MKYMLIILITFGSPVIGEKQKTFEMKIPQESKAQCEKSAKTFSFSLPIINMETRCVPRREDEDAEMVRT
jgi:UDP-3-O-acyl-N-acetylglucosamine deacetylase